MKSIALFILQTLSAIWLWMRFFVRLFDFPEIQQFLRSYFCGKTVQSEEKLNQDS